VIAIVPRFRPALHFGSFSIKETKKEAVSLQEHLLKEYKSPETLFHFIKIPPKSWRYKNAVSYIRKKLKVGKDARL